LNESDDQEDLGPSGGSSSSPPLELGATWGTAEANYAIPRAYLLSAARGGSFFATSKFTTPYAKTSGYSFRVTWEITYE